MVLQDTNFDNTNFTNGIVLYKQKSYEKALSTFLSLGADSGVDTVEVAYYIGLCYAQLQRFEDAMLYLEQVVTTQNNDTRVLQCRFLLAVIYCQTGRIKLANFELEKLLLADYKRSNVLSSMAYIVYLQGDIDKSVCLYEDAIKEDPANTTALNGLGYVLACCNKDLERALECCQKATDKKPYNSAFLDSLGWVHYKMGHKTQAAKYLQQALVYDPDNEEIKEHIKALK